MTDDTEHTDDTDRRHTVNESADKITLTTKVKRGNGTRDQDEIKVKVKGDHPEDTAEKLHATVNAIRSQQTDAALRNIQPDERAEGDE